MAYFNVLSRLFLQSFLERNKSCSVSFRSLKSWSTQTGWSAGFIFPTLFGYFSGNVSQILSPVYTQNTLKCNKTEVRVKTGNFILQSYYSITIIYIQYYNIITLYYNTAILLHTTINWRNYIFYENIQYCKSWTTAEIRF